MFSNRVPYTCKDKVLLPELLKGLKEKALEEGVPYQTLVSMIIHKYVSGKLKNTD